VTSISPLSAVLAWAVRFLHICSIYNLKRYVRESPELTNGSGCILDLESYNNVFLLTKGLPSNSFRLILRFFGNTNVNSSDTHHKEPCVEPDLRSGRSRCKSMFAFDSKGRSPSHPLPQPAASAAFGRQALPWSCRWLKQPTFPPLASAIFASFVFPTVGGLSRFRPTSTPVDRSIIIQTLRLTTSVCRQRHLCLAVAHMQRVTLCSRTRTTSL